MSLLGWDVKGMVTFSSSRPLPCGAVADSNLTRRGRRTPGLKTGIRPNGAPLTSSEKILTHREEEQNKS